MKKAYTIKFTLSTRVIGDETEFKTKEEFENFLEQKGIEQIGEEIWDYFSGDTLDSIKEDENFPYGALEDIEE